VCRIARNLGFLAGFSGNASCRIPAGDPFFRQPEEACLITRSGAAKGRLTPKDFALVSLADGRLLAGPRPSSESALHLALYRQCPDTAAILHTHPPHLLALDLTRPPAERLDLPLPEAAACRAQLAFTPPLPPGSRQLAEAVAEAARTHPAIWLERHGLVVHGPDLFQALALTEELEQLAKIRLLAGEGRKRPDKSVFP
jgi:L-fuculose-phosphate aldolase